MVSSLYYFIFITFPPPFRWPIHIYALYTLPLPLCVPIMAFSTPTTPLSPHPHLQPYHPIPTTASSLLVDPNSSSATLALRNAALRGRLQRGIYPTAAPAAAPTLSNMYRHANMITTGAPAMPYPMGFVLLYIYLCINIYNCSFYYIVKQTMTSFHYNINIICCLHTK